MKTKINAERANERASTRMFEATVRPQRFPLDNCNIRSTTAVPPDDGWALYVLLKNGQT